jgi:ABC-type branched-subunit amino acid transport system substrate-binding protein
VKSYGEAYKESTPSLLDAVGYDSARMLRQLLDKQTASLDRNAVRDALAQMKNFDGATGKTSFNEKREAEKPLFFLTIDPKGIREIGPTERLSGS